MRKPLEEGAREELRGLEFGGNEVVVFVGVVGAEAVSQAKLVFQGVVEPEAGGSAAEEEVVVGEDAPDLAGIGLGGPVDGG